VNLFNSLQATEQYALKSPDLSSTVLLPRSCYVP